MKARTVQLLLQWRAPLQCASDVLAWVAALWLANALRFDFVPGQLVHPRLFALAAVAAVLQLVFGLVFHLYRGRYRFGSFEEVAGVLAAVGATTVCVGLANLAWGSPYLVPRSVPAAAGVIAFVYAVGVRYGWRLFLEHRRRPTAEGAEPLIVFGAGEGAHQVLDAMLRDPTSPYVPVALLDDDLRKGNLRLRGVRVMGARERVGAVADQTGATTLLLAVPSADARLVRDISTIAEQAGLHFKVLPAVAELLDGTVDLSDIRDLDLADLLGRRQIELDLDAIAGYLTGKRVLVTGAGGSIGSELCRQLAQYAPAELLMLDRDESALHAVQLSISGRALLDGDDLILADIRDLEYLNRIFDERRPEVVFHAAALKHLTLLEQNPGEAVKTNVWGTLAVLEAAAAAGVERFINISTDKAADPLSVLGYSKRIAERLTAHVAQATNRRFLSVRFGNVLGSRGSVLSAFTAQVAAGGPVTVTDPDVTRYFMTVQESVALVIQAAAIGGAGEVLVLDMGDPVRIDDVARSLADAAPRRVDIVYTGLRAGEKLHEALLGSGELDNRPHHPLISQVGVPPLAPIAVLELDPWASHGTIVTSLAELSATSQISLIESDRPSVSRRVE